MCACPCIQVPAQAATHRRARTREAMELQGERSSNAGSAFLLLPRMLRGGTMTKLSELIARLRATLKR